MPEEVNIRISGEAGQGMQTIGQALCLIYKNAGLNVFANQDYMSRIKGGNNFFQIRISSRPVYTLRRNVDIAVALDKASITLHQEALTSGGMMLLDRSKFGISQENSAFFDIPLFELAVKTGGNEIFTNSVACGALSAMTGVEFNCVEEVLKAVFGDKPEDAVKKNIAAALAGYKFIKDNFRRRIFQLKAGDLKSQLMLGGHEALSLGAIRAGCKFYCAYPMTPSTGIMNTIAHYAGRFNIAVEQAEDEIAAVNMAIGASFAGVRAMTASSGGGFALMAEGLSLAGMTETPLVTVLAQRPAPATGFPTRTEQGDLDFAIHAGHGEFARVVYAPGTIEEAFYLTVKAFNIAEKYQIPVLILSDQHLADSYRNMEMFDLESAKTRRYIISKEDSRNITGYQRYQLTDSGISPRAIPSWIEEVFYVDSDEHSESGHITEDALTRVKMVEKRFSKKMEGLKREIIKPTLFNVQGAEIILVGFGSTYGILKEAAESIREKKIGFIHLAQVWPFPGEEIEGILGRAKKTISVENNAQAQLARLIRRETGIKMDKSILKFDGRPFDLDFFRECLEKEF